MPLDDSDQVPLWNVMDKKHLAIEEIILEMLEGHVGGSFSRNLKVTEKLVSLQDTVRLFLFFCCEI